MNENDVLIKYMKGDLNTILKPYIPNEMKEIYEKNRITEQRSIYIMFGVAAFFISLGIILM